MAKDFVKLLSKMFADGSYGFSVGSSGALAEFPASTDTRSLSEEHTFSASVPEGAIAIKPLSNLRWVAYETLSRKTSHWNYALIAHADKTPFFSSKRTLLTELGVDNDSLKPPKNREIIFDLGLGLDNADFCIRTSDFALKNILRKYSGKNIAIEGHPVLKVLIDESPTRVVRNAFCRIEVYQAISRTKTPDGPHTHLLLTLLSGASPSRQDFLPRGRLPVFFAQPPSPLYRTQDKVSVLDEKLYQKFQDILVHFGWPTYIEAKRTTHNQLMENGGQADFAWSNDFLTRAGQKVACRQFVYLGPPGLREESRDG